ncbi:DUF4962 domain-containing protein [Cryobacterium arcticum]|nr:DUF4962 domain-containing protein [Cryobacterium arcticum]
MSTNHRPLLLAGREEQLRTDVSSVKGAQFRRLLDECERYRGLPLAAEHPDASITYVGAAAANLALAFRLTGQQHYLTELRRWLDVAVGFPHWGKAHLPDHDLDAGWLLHGLGLAFSWAGDALLENDRARLRDKLILQGTRLHDFAVASEGGWWASSYWQNHNWICFAGLATAAYAIADEHPAAVAWSDLAKANFDTVLDLLPEDGSNNEGVVYWRYGVPWLVSYLDVLRSAEGTDWFPRSAYLRETFWYRLYQAAPDLERIVNHGDCHDRRSGHSVALYYKLAAEYGIPQAQWLARRVADGFFWREAYESGVRPGVRAEAYQELLWFDPDVAEAGPDVLPTSRYFPDLGLVVGRTSWQPDATLVSVKAAPGGGHTAWNASARLDLERGWTTLNAGHQHPDAGSFAILGHGSYLAIDEGYSSRKRTDHHNGVLVDGHGFVNEDRYHVFENIDRQHTAEVMTTTLAGGWVHTVSEIGAMYDPALGVQRLRRHLVMSPSGTVFTVDECVAREPRTFTWLLQTDNPPAPLGDGRYLAQAGSGCLLVTLLGPADATTEVHSTTVQANPTSSTPALAIVTEQYTLRHRTAPVSSAIFVAVLESRPWNGVAPAVVTGSVRDRTVRLRVTAGGHREDVAVHLDGLAPELPVTAGRAQVVGTGFAASTGGTPSVAASVLPDSTIEDGLLR